MQTFVPEGTDYLKGFKALDYRRLGKQRVEAWQILNALRGRSKGWVNHPATKMWRGYEPALTYYGAICCIEWKNRGYKDDMLNRFVDLLRSYHSEGQAIVQPKWLLDSDDVATSHRSNLIRKLPEHYGPLWPDVSDDLEYVWPV